MGEVIDFQEYRKANNDWLKKAEETYFCMAIALCNSELDEPIPVELAFKDQGRFIRELQRLFAQSGYDKRVKFGFSCYNYFYKNGEKWVKFKAQAFWVNKNRQKVR